MKLREKVAGQIRIMDGVFFKLVGDSVEYAVSDRILALVAEDRRELVGAIREGIGLLEWTEDDDWWTEGDFHKERDVWLKKVAALAKVEEEK